MKAEELKALSKGKDLGFVLGDDAISDLINGKAPIFKSYLLWQKEKKKSYIRKESAISIYWKNLSMLYIREAKRYMNDEILFDIRNIYCPSPILR